MQLYYITICSRINLFAVGKYNEYFTSEKGMQDYIEYFNTHLYFEDQTWIETQGTAHVNKNDRIVTD